MEGILRYGGLVGLVFCTVAGFYSLIVAMAAMHQLPNFKRLEIPWGDIPLGEPNPRNIVFTPRYLTTEGQRVR